MMELSAWWVLGAFVIGGYAGALLMALMTITSNDGDDAVDAGDGLPEAGGGARWST